MASNSSHSQGNLACTCTAGSLPLPPPTGCCGLHRSPHTPFPWSSAGDGLGGHAVQSPSAIQSKADEGGKKSDDGQDERQDQRRDDKQVGPTSTTSGRLTLGSRLANILRSSRSQNSTTSSLSPTSSSSSLPTYVSAPPSPQTQSGQSSAPPFDSAHTLTPLHPIVPYHIALDHLDCVRRHRGLDHLTPPTLITELSEKGKVYASSGPSRDWSNEVYYAKGSFLQKQELKYFIWESMVFDPLHLRCCPHQSLDVSAPVFSTAPLNAYCGPRGPLRVEASITYHPRRCSAHASESWSSVGGHYHQVIVCSICHADAELTLEVMTTCLSVRYTCYRDLGAGVKTDPCQPKWQPLLTGQYDKKDPSHRRAGHEEWEVFRRVWHTAKKLRREDLYNVKHHTTHGVFTVATAKPPGL